MAYTLTSSASIIRNADGVTIPDDPLNADWQVYQVWLAAGNTPDPAPSPSPTQAANATYATALAAGLTVNWSTSTTLNGVYGTAQQDQFNITAETVSILTNSTFTNGLTTRNWPTKSGSFNSFTVAQFKALATAIALYVDELQSAYELAAAGQQAQWPSATTTINL